MIKKAMLTALRDGAIRPQDLYGMDDEQFFLLPQRIDFPSLALVDNVRDNQLLACRYETGYSEDSPLHRTAKRAGHQAGMRKRAVLGPAPRIPGHQELGSDRGHPEPISFESDIPIVSDDGTIRPFNTADELFSGPVVDAFARTLRKTGYSFRRRSGPGMSKRQSGRPSADDQTTRRDIDMDGRTEAASDSDKIPYERLIEGDIPPWVMRFVKTTGRVINQYDMIRGGDTVLLGVSGGKDSLALALALSIRRKWLPISYDLKAVMINWIEHPIPQEARGPLQRYFADLGIDFIIKDELMFPIRSMAISTATSARAIGGGSCSNMRTRTTCG
jgi:hypothetical protein